MTDTKSPAEVAAEKIYNHNTVYGSEWKQFVLDAINEAFATERAENEFRIEQLETKLEDRITEEESRVLTQQLLDQLRKDGLDFNTLVERHDRMAAFIDSSANVEGAENYNLWSMEPKTMGWNHPDWLTEAAERHEKK